MDKSDKVLSKKEKTEKTYYVGIGASAGGLEALQDFFQAMPENTGMVFIVIQHLSPDYKSLMDELLARHTKMKIKIAEDGMETYPNIIYLIPPGNNLSIYHGKLYLEKRPDIKGLNLPIDIFFRSLAMDKEKNAIGIILSGTGSDGTLGIKAIKESGGMIMVQDEKSAKFDGMPRSSISTGIVDYILPPSKMPEELLSYIKHPLVSKSTVLENDAFNNLDTLTKIIISLRDFTGIDFSYYKENTIIRRIERRISINRFDKIEEYLTYFKESDKEKEILHRELLIGVTRFFRDTEAFEILKEKVLPEISKQKKTIRIWSAGCSTGEEVYSTAILLQEYIEKNNLNWDIKIFATDIDRNSLEIASKGFYSESIAGDIEAKYIFKYFVHCENGYQIRENIRKMIVFATHNILKDPPFSKLDLIICRNLFIYLKAEMQQKILSMFYYSLNQDGFLFMGSSESIGEMGEAFNVVDSKWKIYKYKKGHTPLVVKDLIMPRTKAIDKDAFLGSNLKISNNIKLEKLLEGAITTVLPPSIIVDSNDNIIHVINDINPFLTVKSGRFSQNIFSNLTNEIGLFVNNILRRLKIEKKEIVFENIVGIKNFENKRLSIKGQIINVEKRNFYLLTFCLMEVENRIIENSNYIVDVEREVSNRVHELERELNITKESLQATVEELETSNEELQSSNEELIASNEELQSTNEELQSVNEELYTVNSEYQIKIDELMALNNDLDNLLKNTEVGALYLDRNLCIRKLTPIVTDITNILASDIGRPISHISIMNHYNELIQDINKVAETLQSIDKEINDEKGKKWIVKIRPYRTKYNSIEGIILTFVEITKLKEQENNNIEVKNRLKLALEIANMAWWELDIDNKTIIYDEKKATMLGYEIEEFPKEPNEIWALIHPDDYKKVMKIREECLKGNCEEWDNTYRIKKKDGKYSWYYERGVVKEKSLNGEAKKIIGTVIDVSNSRKLELEVKQSKDILEKVLNNSPIAKTMVDANGKIIYANKKAEKVFGITQEEILRRSYDDSKWLITDLDGKEIPSKELPFEIIKRTKKPVKGYSHYIEISKNKKHLLNIYGVPVIGVDGDFQGAIFTLEKVEGGSDGGGPKKAKRKTAK